MTRSSRAKALTGTVLLVVLLVLTVLVRTPGVTAHDVALDQAAVAWRTSAATHLFLDLTAAAQETVGAGAVALGAAALWLRRRRWDATRLLLMAGSAWGLALVIKHVVDRPRPPARLWLLTPDATGSFPSGHETTAGVLVLVIAATLVGTRRIRAVLTATGILFALAVGASRVYLGDHYLTDVLGSYFTVSATALLVSAATDAPRVQALGRRLRLDTGQRGLRSATDDAPATVKLDLSALGRRGLPPPPPPRRPR